MSVRVQGRIGFRILTGGPRTPTEIVEGLRGRAAATVADAMGRFGYMDPGIRSRTGLGLCGVAVTVNTRPGDNLMVHKALEVARAGDIVVVSTNGGATSAVFGDLMGHTAVAVGLGGVVVDGAVRDVAGLRDLELPVYSRSVSPGACDKDGPGEINVPVACGGTVVLPGDVVLGDEDGVVVVPREHAREVLDRVQELEEREEDRVAAIGRGDPFPAEIDDVLRGRGVIE